MRKISMFLSLTVLMAVIAACGGAEPELEAVPLAPVAEEVVAEPTAVPEPVIPPTLPPPVISGDVVEEPAAVEEPAVEAVADAPAPPSCQRPWPIDRFGYGVQSHATIGDPGFAMEVAKNQLGMNWIKVQLEWRLVQPSPDDRQWFFYDGVVEQATAKGICLMFSVVGAPEWTRAAGNHIGPPDDFNLYANFLRELLARYPNQVAAVEIWNEQNLDREWQTAEGVSPEQYVNFLSVANQAVKEVDPNVIVISGALAPTGDGDWVKWADDFAWMDRAIAAGLLNHADCIGAHHNGYNIPPDVAFDQTGGLAEAGTATFRGPFDNPHHSWSFKTTIDTYASKIQAVDPNKKVCVTEFGWATSEGYTESPLGFEFALDNTLDEQAQFLVQAFQQMHASGDVWIAYVFNYDFGNKGGGPTDDPVPYSIVDTNGVPRPSFGALASMEKPD